MDALSELYVGDFVPGVVAAPKAQGEGDQDGGQNAEEQNRLHIVTSDCGHRPVGFDTLCGVQTTILGDSG